MANHVAKALRATVLRVAKVSHLVKAHPVKAHPVKAHPVKARRVKARRVKARRVKARRVKARRVKARRVATVSRRARANAAMCRSHAMFRHPVKAKLSVRKFGNSAKR
jgi:hypothetical protein